ncbi:hypothetical protein KIN20_013751 [Parelaphostrongylus tenuis]|uniref:Uncharacterized protein n=1 Tax=Parelaphostrongylus tenuis TaxID=148309 RepID=A0AAD5ME04_PARTN|nr:hypothetical protein KIN20_013751 [Parelaphostrongylus tenuis]
MAPFIAISGDDESTTLITGDGLFVDSFPISAKHLCKPENDLLVMADGARIMIYDTAIRKIMLDERRTSQAVNVSPSGDVIMIDERELITLKLEKSNI